MASGNKLFESADRHRAHIALEYVRGERIGKYIVGGVEPYPGIEDLASNNDQAECREDHNENFPFQVWDAPREPNFRDPEEDIKAAQELDAKIAAKVSAQVDAFMEAFAQKLADKLKL